MNGILVRIGIDQQYGGWNAPVIERSGEFFFVPIHDGKKDAYIPGGRQTFLSIVPGLEHFVHLAGRDLYSDLRFPAELVQRNMHLDPDFEHLTYGDNGSRRGAGASRLVDGDLVVFYAGLQSLESAQLVYAIVGLFVVDRVLRADGIPQDERNCNAHTRWETVSQNDIVVKGKPGLSGRLERCIPIGEYRGKAYRVREELLCEWGGLGVKDGYIQRSVNPPHFVDAARFYEWFNSQQGVLLPVNNISQGVRVER